MRIMTHLVLWADSPLFLQKRKMNGKFGTIIGQDCSSKLNYKR